MDLDPVAVRFASIVLPLLSLGGCSKVPGIGGDGHEHENPATTAQSTDDGHGHGSASEHVDEVTLAAEAIDHYGISVEAAQLWSLRPTIVSPARVGFNTEAMAHVGSVLRGRAVEIPVRLGDLVEKGDALLVVESPELGQAQAEFFQKRTAVEITRPGVDLAKVAWERAQGLYDRSQGISLTEVQRREAEYKAAIGSLKAAESIAIGAENQLHLLGMTQADVQALADSGEVAPRITIRAPIRGHVVEREITLGELVSPDREALLVLADTDNLWVLADVPATRLHEVAVGATAWVRTGPLGSQFFEGKVALLSPLVDAATRTAPVRIEVPAAALALKPGMFAQVEIVATDASGEPLPVVAVPDEAVQTVEGGPAVFVPVADEPNTYAKRSITVGRSVGGMVPVYTGLVEGELYVTGGSFILKAELGKGSAEHVH